MQVSRRHFLQGSAAVTLGFSALKSIGGCARWRREVAVPDKAPRKLFDLPPGFSYTVVSQMGENMDDGLLAPGKADGMCAFPGPEGKTILVRNHELTAEDTKVGPFGLENELLELIDPDMMYDYGGGYYPPLGGTTTIVYDTGARRTERVFLSLAGTMRNCAGGPTPWNTWITCEENVQRADKWYEKDHGYNFEVPATDVMALARPQPLKAMGRFYHEAVAVDPVTGIVYQTEDRDTGLIYRFIPTRPGDLLAGGRLQAMKIRGAFGWDTRNWHVQRISSGQSVEVEWVDCENIQSPDDDLRFWGFFMKGCARFARGEGMWHGRDGIYFTCTNGGATGNGQIWRYTPSPTEGQADEARRPGKLELFLEPAEQSVAQNADNLTMAPWGDIFVCEDRIGTTAATRQRLLRITPAGEVFEFGRNALNKSELAGVTFSPDGSTLFVNIFSPGITLAITGPWREPPTTGPSTTQATT